MRKKSAKAPGSGGAKNLPYVGRLLGAKTRISLYLVFWAVVLVGFSLTILSQLDRLDEFAAQEALLYEQIAAAHQVTRQLEHDLQFHYSDAFVERIARERLGFIRADETIFINDAR